MTEHERICIETFPEWLRTLADDANDLAAAVADENLPQPLRRYAAAGLNYLFKSLDLIPDGIEDLGYLDDAFVLRVAAKLAVDTTENAAQHAPRVARLASETSLIETLLDTDFTRLRTYVENLTGGAARGRTVDEILENDAVRSDFLNEVSGWATSYEAPSFSKDEKNLVKMKSFLSAKLP